MNFRTVGILIAALWMVSCSGTEPIVVGSGNTTEQRILGEIIAQHLEARLGDIVQRRPSMGTTGSLFGAMQTSELSLFVDYTSQIVSEILEERPGSDPEITLQRARGEMRRVSKMSVGNPLGFDARYVAVIPNDPEVPIFTISEALERGDGWALGTSRAFQTSDIGLPRLNEYRIPLSAEPRATELTDLFPFMLADQFTMVIVPATSGWLLDPRWRELADDQVIMPPLQAVIVTREAVLETHPTLQAALDELTGKISLQKMREMNAAVDIDEEAPEDVAAAFLREAGLN